MPEVIDELVVVIPGVTGSVLARGDAPVWGPSGGALLRALRSFGRSVTSLELPNGIGDEDPKDGVTATRGGRRLLRGSLVTLQVTVSFLLLLGAGVFTGTLHNMRCVFLDNDTKLLFATAYDGEWDPYIDDFATKIPDMMDYLFSNVEGWPGRAQLRSSPVSTSRFPGPFRSARRRSRRLVLFVCLPYAGGLQPDHGRAGSGVL